MKTRLGAVERALGTSTSTSTGTTVGTGEDGDDGTSGSTEPLSLMMYQEDAAGTPQAFYLTVSIPFDQTTRNFTDGATWGSSNTQVDTNSGRFWVRENPTE